MAFNVQADITYSSSGINFGGSLAVNKLRVHRSAGTESVTIATVFLGTGMANKVVIQLSPEVATLLARSLMSAADGYASTIESEV
jgi:hypothetical protein